MIDFIKTLYLMWIRFVSACFNTLPLRKKIVFFVTFRQNTQFILQDLQKRQADAEIVFVCNHDSYEAFEKELVPGQRLVSLEKKSHFFRRIYHLMTSKVIVVDNYYPFLAGVTFKPEAECIQIWHAAGAIKKFGFEAENTLSRSPAAIRRFREVYRQFHKIVVGSEKMADIFQRSFDFKEDKFIRTGIPRTDLFFDDERIRGLREAFFARYPQAAGKKILLYAPTFRDEVNHRSEFNALELQQQLGEDYFCLIKLHPITSQKVDLPPVGDRFVKVDSSHDVNELLLVTDILVSDYSSIPFEFALLGRPMIFFPYDLESYIMERGVTSDYQKLVPGPIVRSTAELAEAVKNVARVKSHPSVAQFNREWNGYSTGRSSEQFVSYLLDRLGERQKNQEIMK